jgi:hypothetical protein
MVQKKALPAMTAKGVPRNGSFKMFADRFDERTRAKSKSHWNGHANTFEGDSSPMKPADTLQNNSRM